MEFDFDQMAKEFAELRASYLEYKRGGSQEQARKRLDRYILVSDRFFSKYPNPFAERDDDFSAPVTQRSSRASYKALSSQLQRLISVKQVIETKLTNLKKDDHQRIKKYEDFLDDCEQKIKKTKFLIDEVDTSQLPG